MTPIEQVVATYFGAWNAPTREECANLLAKSCSPSIAYVDPRYVCRGLGEVAERIHQSRVLSPSYRVDVTSSIDGYDDVYRYTWLFDVVEKPVRVPGLDVIVRDRGGLIVSLTSFFGHLDVAPEIGGPLRLQPRWGA